MGDSAHSCVEAFNNRAARLRAARPLRNGQEPRAAAQPRSSEGYKAGQAGSALLGRVSCGGESGTPPAAHWGVHEGLVGAMIAIESTGRPASRSRKVGRHEQRWRDLLTAHLFRRLAVLRGGPMRSITKSRVSVWR